MAYSTTRTSKTPRTLPMLALTVAAVGIFGAGFLLGLVRAQRDFDIQVTKERCRRVADAFNGFQGPSGPIDDDHPRLVMKRLVLVADGLSEHDTRDAWGRALDFVYDDEGDIVGVTSSGPDGEQGTQDDISYIFD